MNKKEQTFKKDKLRPMVLILKRECGVRVPARHATSHEFRPRLVCCESALVSAAIRRPLGR